MTDYDEKVQALESLMNKLQKEGGYRPMSDEVYQKTINITQVFKIICIEIRGKIKVYKEILLDNPKTY